MLLHIMNYRDAERRSCIAGTNLVLGSVVKIAANGNGERSASKVTAAGDLLPGNFAVAFKVWSEPSAVATSTVNSDTARDYGSRIMTISAGDQMVEATGPRLYLWYDLSLLDATLVTSGAFNGVIGDALGIDPTTAQFCKANKAGAIVAPVVARVYDIVNGKPVIVLVDMQ